MSAKQLIELRQKQADLQANWDRQAVTLASGALALLAGLGPPTPAGFEKYFLAATWVFLGLGIVSGAAATYLHVSAAKNLANKFHEQLLNSIQNDRELSPNVPIVAHPHKVFSWSKPLMVISLLLAVCNLVAYAVITTIGA